MERRSLRNADLPKGMVRTAAGHLRYTSPGVLRGQYVHRKVIADLIEATPYSIRLLLPWPYEGHHMDYNKENNAPHNLLIVSEPLHAAMTADRARKGNGRFKPKWSKPPEWLPLYDDREEENGDNEVPF